MAVNHGPLDGVTVLDFSRFQQGALATLLLADLGADIIKVEQPGGDPGRLMLLHEDGHSSFFESLNRGKRSLVLDLRADGAQDVVHRLVRGSDVLIENFRPGTADRLGLGYETVAAINPGLVYASASTFGPYGPRAADPGFDHVAQAASGMVMANRRGDEPPRLPYGALADNVGGMILAQSILAALVHRERHGGLGQRVAISLYGSMLTLQARSFHAERYKRRSPVQSAERSAGTVTMCVEASDGPWLVFGLLEGRAWPDLCTALGAPELSHDERFATAAARSDHAGELAARVATIVAGQPAADLVARLRATGVPVSVVQDYDMIAEDQQALANGYVTAYQHPLRGRIEVVGAPAHFSETPTHVRGRAAIQAGEHTAQILTEHGFSAEDTHALVAAGVVTMP